MSEKEEREGVEKFGVEYMRALIKSQRNVIASLMDEAESYKEEIRQLRISLGMLDTISIRAEEIKLKREGLHDLR